MKQLHELKAHHITLHAIAKKLSCTSSAVSFSEMQGGKEASLSSESGALAEQHSLFASPICFTPSNAKSRSLNIVIIYSPQMPM